MKYDIYELEKKFLLLAKQRKDRDEKYEKEFRKVFPDEPILERLHFDDDCKICLALAEMCAQIVKLKKKIDA